MPQHNTLTGGGVNRMGTLLSAVLSKSCPRAKFVGTKTDVPAFNNETSGSTTFCHADVGANTPASRLYVNACRDIFYFSIFVSSLLLFQLNT